MVLLENDAFLTELTHLFVKCKNAGPLTMSILKYDGKTKPEPRPEKQVKVSESKEDLCLIRAKLARKKLSTVVHQKDLNKFQLAYANVLKANIDGLKKKEKSRIKKPKAAKT